MMTYKLQSSKVMPNASSRTRQTGLSLIELMISIVLGLFLMAAALQVLLASKQSFRLEKESSNVQENARFAVEMLSREISLAGFTGCRATPRVASVVNGSGVAAKWEYGAPGIEAFDDSQAPSVFPATFSTRTTGTDVVIARGGSGGSLVTVSSYASPIFQFAAGTNVSDVIKPGDLAIASDQYCQQVSVLQVSASTSTTVTYAAAGTPGNCTLLLGSNGPSTCAVPSTVAAYFNAGSNFMPYSVSGFYVAPSASDATIPALWRARLITSGGAAQVRREELLQGVENLQLLYGYDTDATSDNVPNVFAKANDTVLIGSAWDWNRVVSVRVAILLRSLAPVALTAHVNPSFEGAAVPTDRFERQRVYTTVQLKNHRPN